MQAQTEASPTRHEFSIIYSPLFYIPNPYPGILSILAKSHSLLHRGHTLLVLNHLWMQSK